jgi:hypothetical protein
MSKSFNIEVLCVIYNGDIRDKEWRKVHPSNGGPYIYASRDAAELDARKLYPDSCRDDVRVVEVSQ